MLVLGTGTTSAQGQLPKSSREGIRWIDHGRMGTHGVTASDGFALVDLMMMIIVPIICIPGRTTSWSWRPVVELDT
jgi:hypothetical protein